MEEKVDIVALGELLIDFTEAGHSQGGRKLFEQNPGGAPANLLTVASHFGYRTSFIGKEKFLSPFSPISTNASVVK